MAVSQHEFYETWFTGNIVCAKCKLLPLDEDDYQSECDSEQGDGQ